MCIRDRLEKAEEIRKNYAQYLDTEDQNLLISTGARASCYIAFEQGAYKTVLAKVQEINVRDKPNHLIDRYIFYIKANFELGETHLILEKDEAFSNYLKDNYDRHQLGLDYKNSYQNFFDLTVMIINAKHERFTKEFLLEKLDSFKGLVADSKWLRRKIELLPKKSPQTTPKN